MKIVMTGGGSGGHITPILAVAHEVKSQSAAHEVIYIGQTGEPLLDVPEHHPSIDMVYTVSAGKLRRYANEGWRQLLDVRTQALNIRDIFRTLGGFFQSLKLLHTLKPDVVFCKGGFVGVPVGLAAAVLRIPYVTHDSDVTPGLANRIIAHWAAKHAVALAADEYPYPAAKTVSVGVPIAAEYTTVAKHDIERFRALLGMESFSHVLFVTGGGNGARALNQAVVSNSRYLLGTFPGLLIVHVAGRALEDETNAAYEAVQLGAARERVWVLGFVDNLYAYSGAADIVVARGGATNLAEFAAQAKACLLVPSKQLSWNVKNSVALEKKKAVVVLDEDQIEQPERLGRTLEPLLRDETTRLQLGRRLATIAHPDAANELAAIIIELGSKAGKR